MTAYTNELVGALHQARHLAVKIMTPVSLCSSNNGRDCTQTPWPQGYITFYDTGLPGVVDGDDRVVHVVQPRKTPIRVVLKGADHIRFLKSGGVLADASPSGQRRSIGQPEQAMVLASLLNRLSPVSTAHAATAEGSAENSIASAPPVAFLVCSGQIGRAIRVTAIGHLDTSTVACR